MALPPNEFLRFLADRAKEIIGSDDLKKRIAERKRIRVKLGIDPTAPDLHIGHMVPLRMLRAFQDAGHRAVLIIGDFTASIGDPSGRSGERKQLVPAEVKRNERTYLRQVSTVLNMRTLEVRHNSEWFSKMRLADFLRLLTHVSLRSAWEREDFQNRLQSGKSVRLHEAMYLVLQAYDSVAVRADVELGAIDQKLNILGGRALQASLGMMPQAVVLLPHLIGLDGALKMSKSVGNTVNIKDPPQDMFGKIMSIPDGLIVDYARLAAWLPEERVRAMEQALRQKKENPRDIKLDVAEAITGLYHGKIRGERARAAFLQVFSRREITSSVPSVGLARLQYQPIDLILELGVASSRGEARRLLHGKALEVDGHVILSDAAEVPVRSGSVIRVGKKHFFRVR